MKTTAPEQTINLAAIPAPEKQPAVLKAFHELCAGGSILLLNDRDPLPLYYHFACEYLGGFHWEYIENGPVQWQVRLCKGDFPEPGYVPIRRSPAQSAASLQLISPRVIDTRPIFARGEVPCAAIDEAVAGLSPGQTLV